MDTSCTEHDEKMGYGRLTTGDSFNVQRKSFEKNQDLLSVLTVPRISTLHPT